MKLLEYSILSVFGYHFHFRSLSPVIFGFYEVANEHLSFAGCRLAGFTLMPLAAASHRLGSTVSNSQFGSTSITFTYCITVHYFLM